MPRLDDALGLTDTGAACTSTSEQRMRQATTAKVCLDLSQISALLRFGAINRKLQAPCSH